MPAPRKFPRFPRRTLWLILGGAGTGGLLLQAQGPAVGRPPVVAGALTCATSGCHGGADDRSDQYALWSERDVHSRSSATLVTARAARMGEALGIADPGASARCTICHEPMKAVGPGLLAADAVPTEGVSCTSCHGLPESWLRSHTRPDWTHADRVAAGLRDLDDLYVRANTCVACHQDLAPDLVAVGRHPALTFELDGQARSEPPHWRERPGTGPQAWFVGQAVALREMSAALARPGGDSAIDAARWQGLLWVLRQAAPAGGGTALEPLSAATAATAPETAVAAADGLARSAARAWPAEDPALLLRRLAGTAAEFLTPGVPALVQACRGERLVLGLDRLLAALPSDRRPPGASAQLDRLFQLVQSRPDFSAPDFARALDAFSRTVGPSSGR